MIFIILYQIYFQQYKMNYLFLLILCLSWPLSSFHLQFQPFQNNCNATHFQFHSNQTFAKGLQFNTTLDMVQDIISPLQNVTYRNGDASYVISYSYVRFAYLQQFQKAQLIMPNQILIDGSYADVSVNFTWQKLTPNYKRGTGKATGKTQQLSILMSLNQYDRIPKYQLSSFTPFNCYFLNLTKTDQPLTSQQKTDLQMMVSGLGDFPTLRSILVNRVARSWSLELNHYSVSAQNLPYTSFMYYDWMQDDREFNFTMYRRPVSFYFTKIGVMYAYEGQIDGMQDGQCGSSVPVAAKDISTYGSSQSFISLTFVKNFIKYAIENQALDQILVPEKWSSPSFHFIAGQLYSIIANISGRFSYNSRVQVNCSANSSPLEVFNIVGYLQVKIGYDCDISISQARILGLGMNLTLRVNAVGQDQFIDFGVEGFQYHANYKEVKGFEVINKEALDRIVLGTVNRILEADKLVGSGWLLYPIRPNMGFYVDDNTILFY